MKNRKMFITLALCVICSIAISGMPTFAVSQITENREDVPFIFSLDNRTESRD